MTRFRRQAALHVLTMLTVLLLLAIGAQAQTVNDRRTTAARDMAKTSRA